MTSQQQVRKHSSIAPPSTIFSAQPSAARRGRARLPKGQGGATVRRLSPYSRFSAIAECRQPLHLGATKSLTLFASQTSLLDWQASTDCTTRYEMILVILDSTQRTGIVKIAFVTEATVKNKSPYRDTLSHATPCRTSFR